MLTWGDVVKVQLDAPSIMRPGALGTVVAISMADDRAGLFLAEFPAGAVYTVEYSDGSSSEIPEGLLEPASD